MVSQSKKASTYVLRAYLQRLSNTPSREESDRQIQSEPAYWLVRIV
jgi:hypothetical protein